MRSKGWKAQIYHTLNGTAPSPHNKSMFCQATLFNKLGSGIGVNEHAKRELLLCRPIPDAEIKESQKKAVVIG